MRKQYILLLFMIACIIRQGVSQVKTLPTSALQEDYRILERVLEEVHPGLYRYNSEEQMKQNFQVLKNHWAADTNEKIALKQLAQFLEKIKCGHTCINPYNVEDSLKNRLYPQKSFLPFYFRIIDKKIIITDTALEDLSIKPGQEIVSINGQKASLILDSLLTAVKSDGRNNIDTKYKTLEISSADPFSVFDMLYPLFFPSDNTYVLQLKEASSQKVNTYTIGGISATERREAMLRKQKAPLSDKPWSLEIKENHIGVLTMKSWFTYKFKTNWRKLLSGYFKELNEKSVDNLIIDIRDNVGGDGNVGQELLSYIATNTIKPNIFYRQVVGSTSIDKQLWPYFLPWANAYKKKLPDHAVKQLENGSFELLRHKSEPIIPQKVHYKGKVFIIINAANSSATFNFADIVSQNKIATLVGQKTGGNKQGINANNFIFLMLPHSKFTIDIPLVFNDAGYSREEGGVSPDLEMLTTQKDISNGIDRELTYIFELIAKSGK